MWNGMLTVTELAEKMGYTPQNITRMAREKRIRFLRRGRRYFFPKDVVEELTETNNGDIKLK
jgi:excisionase family DNA binding protein